LLYTEGTTVVTGEAMKRGDKFRMGFLPDDCIVTAVRKGIVYFKSGADKYQTPLAVIGAASPAEGPTPPTMEIEEAAREIIRTLRPADPNSWETNMPYLIARLETLAGPKPSPRCPKCGSERMALHFGSDLVGWLGTISCAKCGLGKNEPYDLETWDDVWAFFTPSAGEGVKK
jgi:ribosomal protein S27AE